MTGTPERPSGSDDIVGIMTSLHSPLSENDNRSRIEPRDLQQQHRGQNHDRIGGVDHKSQDEGSLDVEISITQKMLSAVTGSVLTSLLVTPLDVVRVRLQSQPRQAQRIPGGAAAQSFQNLPPNLGMSACCREVFWVNNNSQFCVAGPRVGNIDLAGTVQDCLAEETQKKHINSTFDGLRKIARNEGIFTLWRGLSPTLVMAVPANVIYFAGYDWLRTSKKSPLTGRVSDTCAPLAAGSAARIMAAIAVSPIEMFRTRMQAAHSASPTGVFKDTIVSLRELVHKDGYFSLWRGLTLTLWRDVPFSAFYWWGYETGRNAITDFRGRNMERDPSEPRARRRSRSREEENHMSTLIDSFAAGATSGAVAALVTTPFDVGKTRQQVLQHSSESSNSGKVSIGGKMIRPEEASMPRFLWHILKEEGASGLFKGWAARCLKVAPACAIMISSYEIGKKMAGEYDRKRVGRHQEE